MNTISVQPITDRPIIDAIAPDDFMLIGDASDNNVVKRVLISGLPFSIAGQLAIADYSWATLPNKPLTFLPSVHRHEVSEIDGFSATLAGLAPIDYSHIKQPAKPLVRANGLALEINDIWHEANTNSTYFWNGVFWLTLQQFIGIASTNFANGGVINLITSGAIPLKIGYENQLIFLESMTYGLSVNGIVDTNNYYRLGAAVIRANGAVTAVDGVPTVDLLTVPTAQGTLDLNTLTTSYANNPAAFLVAQFIKIGSGTNILTCQITFRYRLVAS